MRTRTKLHIPGATFNLGDKVKAVVTGFEGIATAHRRHLTGCDTVSITSQTETSKFEGGPTRQEFDVLEVELVESNPLKIEGFPEQEAPAG